MPIRHALLILAIVAEVSVMFYGAARAITGAPSGGFSTAGGSISMPDLVQWTLNGGNRSHGRVGAFARGGVDGTTAADLRLFAVNPAQGQAMLGGLASTLWADPNGVPPIAGPVAVAGPVPGSIAPAGLGGGGSSRSREEGNISSAANSGTPAGGGQSSPNSEDPIVDPIDDPTEPDGPNTTPVPLPGAVWLLLGGLGGLVGLKRKKA